MEKFYFCVYLTQSFHYFHSDRIWIFEGSPYCPRAVDFSVARRSTRTEGKLCVGRAGNGTSSSFCNIYDWRQA